ncbi:MAG: sialidase family protein, partial [Gemmatimonadota bacterium]
DGGKSWSPEVPMRPHKEINPLTDPLGRTLAQKDPWLTVDERGVLYFGWLETISHVQGMQEVLDTSLVLVARSGDEGATWSTAVNVQRVQPGRADKPSIASDAAGTLYVGYTLVSPNQSVVVTRSLDGGETWSTPVELATGNVLISNLAAGPAGQVCAGWFDLASRSVRVGCSSDQGSTWLTTAVGEAKSDDVGRIFSPGPHVAASRGGTFAVAWIDPEFNLRVIRSEDAGATWSQATAVNDESQGRRWQPTVAIGSDDRLHASWYDDRTGLIHVVYSSSVDGGQTWSPNLRVTSEPTPFGRNRDSGTGFRFTAPDDTRLGDYMGLAAAEDGSVHVLWTDWRSSFQAIFHAHIP